MTLKEKQAIEHEHLKTIRNLQEEIEDSREQIKRL